MGHPRRCSRPSCGRQAESTLTYVYADSIAVIGPLATVAEPHSYDMCQVHGQRMSAPKGWELIRIEPDLMPAGPRPEDLEALANAVREAGSSRSATLFDADDDRLPGAVGAEGIRRGHLRALPTSRSEV